MPHHFPAPRSRLTAVVERARSARCRGLSHDALGPHRRPAPCRVGALITLRGLTAPELARVTGRREATVLGWLRGKRLPSDEDTLLRLAGLLRVDLPALLDSREPCPVQYVRAACAALGVPAHSLVDQVRLAHI